MKLLRLLMMVMLIVSPLSFAVAADASARGVTINIDGQKQAYSDKAIIKNGSTLVPLRGLFESLGAEVTWNNADRSIDAKKGNKEIWLKIGSTTTKVNGKPVQVAVPPEIVNGNTLVPLRFISEALGADVKWTGATYTIDITSAEKLGPVMQVHFIDVGQGDATFIQTPMGKTILIDGGKREAGKQVVSYIKSLGVKKLDFVVATHPDADHIGGLIAVLNSISIGQFIDSGKVHTTATYEQMLRLIDEKNIPFMIAEAGDVIIDDQTLDFYFKVLVANSNAANNNDASVVVEVGYCGTDVLLMGDAGTNIESDLLNDKTNVSADILKAGHHGSSTSSSLSFLKAVNPEAVVLSYGADNDYGHPHAEVLHNIAAVKASIYSTATSGTVVVTVNCGGYSFDAKELIETTIEPEVEKPAPQPVPTPTPQKTYKNCTELRVDFPNGVSSTHWAYQKKMDRDNDGWACE